MSSINHREPSENSSRTPFKRYTKHDYLWKKNECVQIPVSIPVKKKAPRLDEPSPVKQYIEPSLDNNGQFSPTSSKIFVSNSWSKKQKRAYHCALSGLKRCHNLGIKAFFLTLTSSPKTNHPDLRKDWDILVKRIRKLFPKFQYVKVETFEGHGVIHALYHHAFEDWNYSDIHLWLSNAWSDIHQAPIVWNVVVGEKYSIKKVSSYLCQYMSGQRGFFRRSTSLNWIFAGYRKKWTNLIKRYGFRKALFAWDFLLSTSTIKSWQEGNLEKYLDL
jgi:hypothetical protein